MCLGNRRRVKMSVDILLCAFASAYIRLSLELNMSMSQLISEFDFYTFFIFELTQVETLTFLGILLFFIVIGNSAVLAALMMGKTQRKSRMNFFIMHLALAGKKKYFQKEF